MTRIVFVLAALLGACSADEFVAAPALGPSETAVFLIRETADTWRREVLDAQSGPLRLTEPLEVYAVRYPHERTEVEAWLAGGGLERCALLAGEARQLRLNEPVEFIDVTLPEALNAELLPEWDQLCVSCKPFRVRTTLYPVPQGSLNEKRSGGGHAPLPSGAFLTAGRSEDGFFRVTRTEATALAGRSETKPIDIHLLPDGRYVAAEAQRLAWLEVNEEETAVTSTTMVRVDELGADHELTDMQVTPPGQSFAALMTDSKARVLRTDGTSLEVVVELPLPPGQLRIFTGMIVVQSRDHFYFVLDRPTLFEWREGRLLRHELGGLPISTIALIPGFGLLAGTDGGEVWAFESQGWRPLGSTGLLDDVHLLLPHRNGFLAIVKGGFVSQYAGHLQRFCPELTELPGAQNAELTSISAVPEGFFCSNCNQSRSGGAYGAIWIEFP